MKSIAILLATAALPLGAQWLTHPDAQTPRTKDGKPNLTAPAPRMNGRPDLSGVWQAQRTPMSEYARALGNDPTGIQVDLNDVTKEYLNVFWGIKPGTEPLRPEAAAIMKQRAGQAEPTARCLPAGVPSNIFIFAFKIVQAPREIVVLLEAGDPSRQIYTDGRSLPPDSQPSWMGYSVGKWEGETLAVETTGFTEQSWLDGAGHPRSESMRIRERYHRRDFGHMDLDVTVEDPKYYTRPITLKTQLNLIPDSDVIENVCTENEKDRSHLDKP